MVTINNTTPPDYYATVTILTSVFDDDYYYDDYNNESAATTVTPDANFGYGMRIIISCILLASSVLGVCGNSLVILSVVLSRKLRSATYEFIFNLSCADLLISLVTPVNVIALTTTAMNNEWPFADWLCTGTAGVLFLCVGCSLFTLASISVERLLVCTRQVIFYRKFCSGALIVWIIATWLAPFLLLIMPTFVGVGGLGYDMMYHSCAAKSDQRNSKIFNRLMMVTVFILIGLMLLSYTLISAYVLRRGKKTIKTFTTSQENLMVIQETSFTSEIRDVNVMTDTAAGRDLSARLRRRQFLLAKHTFYVVFAFLCSVTPYGVCIALPDAQAYVPYAATLLLVNSALNPLIYTRHHDFRRIFVLILQRRWSDIPKPSRMLERLLGR